jgi:hypothetical protein
MMQSGLTALNAMIEVKAKKRLCRIVVQSRRDTANVNTWVILILVPWLYSCLL